MTRSAATLVLLICCQTPLAAQWEIRASDGAVAAIPAPAVMLAEADTAAPPLPPDTAIAEKPLGGRILGGAIVGAVTGGALSAQGSDCAPSGSPARASFVGAAFGAIRAALKWDTSNDLPLPDTRDNGGQEGPFPFDGENCEIADPNEG